MSSQLEWPPFRIGQGWDSHPRDPEPCPLVLGGIELAPTGGCLAHSDGDVLLHAVIDAILGAMAWGDIGHWFPDHDEQWRKASSLQMLKHVLRCVQQAGWCMAQADMTLVLDSPKLAPHHEALKESLSQSLGLRLDRIGLKAKTTEGLTTFSESQVVMAWAMVLLTAVPTTQRAL